MGWNGKDGMCCVGFFLVRFLLLGVWESKFQLVSMHGERVV